MNSLASRTYWQSKRSVNLYHVNTFPTSLYMGTVLKCVQFQQRKAFKLAYKREVKQINEVYAEIYRTWRCWPRSAECLRRRWALGLWVSVQTPELEAASATPPSPPPQEVQRTQVPKTSRLLRLQESQHQDQPETEVQKTGDRRYEGHVGLL